VWETACVIVNNNMNTHQSISPISHRLFWLALIGGGTLIVLFKAYGADAPTNTVTITGTDPATVAAALTQYINQGFTAGLLHRLVTAWPKITAFFLLVGVMRPFLHSFNQYLVRYCQASLSRQQFAQLVHISGSPNFRRLEFVIHMIFSIQPSLLLGAVQISAAGNGPETIKLPTYGSVPLGEAPPTHDVIIRDGQPPIPGQ